VSIIKSKASGEGASGARYGYLSLIEGVLRKFDSSVSGVRLVVV
jgi:hypothetical protein